MLPLALWRPPHKRWLPRLLAATRLQPAALVVATLLMALPSGAPAQPQDLKDKVATTARRIGVHFNTSIRESFDQDVSAKPLVGISVGLSPSETGGWSVPVSLNLNPYDLVDHDVRFAKVRSYFVLSGVAYSIRRGRWSVGSALEGGFALNRSRLEDTAPETFGVPGTAVRISDRNSFVTQPQIRAEYFVTGKVSVRTSLRYLYTRPNIEVATINGRVPDEWNTPFLNLNVGVGIYPFRKAPAAAPTQAPGSVH